MNTPAKITVVFTPYFTTHETRDALGIQRITEWIRDAHRAACEAHEGEGVKNIRLDYINRPDEEKNPLGTIGRFRVTIGCPEGEDTQTSLGFESVESIKRLTRWELSNEIRDGLGLNSIA